MAPLNPLAPVFVPSSTSCNPQTQAAFFKLPWDLKGPIYEMILGTSFDWHSRFRAGESDRQDDGFTQFGLARTCRRIYEEARGYKPICHRTFSILPNGVFYTRYFGNYHSTEADLARYLRRHQPGLCRPSDRPVHVSATMADNTIPSVFFLLELGTGNHWARVARFFISIEEAREMSITDVSLYIRLHHGILWYPQALFAAIASTLRKIQGVRKAAVRIDRTYAGNLHAADDRYARLVELELQDVAKEKEPVVEGGASIWDELPRTVAAVVTDYSGLRSVPYFAQHSTTERVMDWGSLWLEMIARVQNGTAATRPGEEMDLVGFWLND